MKKYSLLILFIVFVAVNCGDELTPPKKPPRSLKQIKTFLDVLGSDESEHRMYFVSKKTRDFNDSKNICNKLGLRLTSMDSRAEHDWVLLTLNSIKDSNGGFFIGVTRGANDTWNRIDNRGVINFDFNFRAGEPNNHFNSEDCIETKKFYDTQEFELNDLPCTEQKRFICVLDQ